jgi:uncharacterized lipoprotein YmbA
MSRVIAMLLAAAALTACGKTDPAPAAPDLPPSSPASAPAEAASAALQPAEMRPAALQSVQAQQTLVEQLSGVWKPVDEQLLMTIRGDLSDGQVDIMIGNQHIPAAVESVDARNSIVVLQVDLNGSAATWSFRRIVDEQGAFHFRATLHNGVESELSFVRNLSASDAARLASASEQERINRNAAQKVLHEAAPDARQ